MDGLLVEESCFGSVEFRTFEKQRFVWFKRLWAFEVRPGRGKAAIDVE